MEKNTQQFIEVEEEEEEGEQSSDSFSQHINHL